MISLGKTLSAELLLQSVRVNVVGPGPLTTPLYGKPGPATEQWQAKAASVQTQAPPDHFDPPNKSP